MTSKFLAFGLMALAINACGTGKHKRNPAVANNAEVNPIGGQVLPGENSFDESYDCAAQSASQSVAQSDSCFGNANLAERSFRVIKKFSYRRTDTFALDTNTYTNVPVYNQGPSYGYGNDEAPVFTSSNQIATEQCLRTLRMAGESFDMGFANMDLRAVGQGGVFAAHCEVQLGLAFKRGYRFAIRQVSGSVVTSLPQGGIGAFRGSVTVDRRPALIVRPNNPQMFGAQVYPFASAFGGQDMVWSNCSGYAEITINTALAVARWNGQGTANPVYGNGSIGSGGYPVGQTLGTLSVNSAVPYRFEVVWAPCT